MTYTVTDIQQELDDEDTCHVCGLCGCACVCVNCGCGNADQTQTPTVEHTSDSKVESVESVEDDVDETVSTLHSVNDATPTVLQLVMRRVVENVLGSLTFVSTLLASVVADVRTIYWPLGLKAAQLKCDEVCGRAAGFRHNTQRHRVAIDYRQCGRHYQVVYPRPTGVSNRRLTSLMGQPEEVARFHRAMGPFRNFHGIPTTPSMLGYETPIEVYYSDDSGHMIEPDQVIPVC